ncbi:MAG: hypothetical protein ACRCTX_11070, partial [Afipia sp.]
ELIERHKSLRKLGRLMFGAFSFRSFRPDDPVLKAVDHLRALYSGRKASRHGSGESVRLLRTYPELKLV